MHILYKQERAQKLAVLLISRPCCPLLLQMSFVAVCCHDQTALKTTTWSCYKLQVVNTSHSLTHSLRSRSVLANRLSDCRRCARLAAVDISFAGFVSRCASSQSVFVFLVFARFSWFVHSLAEHCARFLLCASLCCRTRTYENNSRAQTCTLSLFSFRPLNCPTWLVCRAVHFNYTFKL